MYLQLLSGTFSKASCCCGGKSGTDWAVTTNEVIEHGNTKARAPSVRPGQLQIHTANGSVQSLCVLQKEERGGYSSFQKALFPLESSPFLYAFPEAEMFALTLEQPFLQDKEEECDFFFLRKEKDGGQWEERAEGRSLYYIFSRRSGKDGSGFTTNMLFLSRPSSHLVGRLTDGLYSSLQFCTFFPQQQVHHFQLLSP